MIIMQGVLVTPETALVITIIAVALIVLGVGIGWFLYRCNGNNEDKENEK